MVQVAACQKIYVILFYRKKLFSRLEKSNQFNLFMTEPQNIPQCPIK